MAELRHTRRGHRARSRILVPHPYHELLTQRIGRRRIRDKRPYIVLKEVAHEMVQHASFCDTSTLMSGGAAAWTDGSKVRISTGEAI